MSALISHSTGNPNSKQAALALAEAGYLAECHTTIATPTLDGWFRCLPLSLRATLRKRAFPEEVSPFLKLHPWRELTRQIWLRLRIKRLAKFADIRWVADNFDREVARSVSRSHAITLVYAYMDAAEQTFHAAKKQGCLTVYELPTPYWRFTRNVVDEELLREPEWGTTLPILVEDDPVMRRRDRELQLADVIVVPSEFVRSSLQLAPPFQGKVCVVPYGCPQIQIRESSSRVSSASGDILRVIYVGSLNQGKGLSYLASAIDAMGKSVSLTVIGSDGPHQKPCVPLNNFLGMHRHLSGIPNDAVMAEMRRHDVLVLPTLYEGLALVLLEAMACGLTVITTENSGLAGMITNGREGFVVPVRDARALLHHLQHLAADRVLLASMRASAQAWSCENSWRHYRNLLRKVIADSVWTGTVAKKSAESAFQV